MIAWMAASLSFPHFFVERRHARRRVIDPRVKILAATARRLDAGADRRPRSVPLSLALRGLRVEFPRSAASHFRNLGKQLIDNISAPRPALIDPIEVATLFRTI